MVGLGNFGRKYKKTKHNAGFLILDELISKMGLSWKKEKKFKSEVCSSGEVVFMKPLTFMNLSGEAVSKTAGFYKIEPKNIVVVHDDVDFDFGVWKLQFEKDAAGHRGVRSIIDFLGTNRFWRVRFGIGRPPEDEFEVERYVLSSFTKQELKDIKDACTHIFDILNKNIFEK